MHPNGLRGFATPLFFFKGLRPLNPVPAHLVGAYPQTHGDGGRHER
jgi:hypothetical protein